MGMPQRLRHKRLPFLAVAGVTIMFIATLIFVADLSMVRPRPKPQPPVETPPPVEQALTQVSPQTLPRVVLIEKEAERLKRMENQLQEQRAQAQRIDRKLDEFLRVEEAKDAGTRGQ